ncbi:Proteophosphoglycan 5 [Rhodotorula toruloides]|nr:Proteophosphoglycan 5 [Rhodotorula toruloides]
MLASLFSSPTVKVTLNQDEIFVHPVDEDYPTQDPVLRGTTLLSLPSRKAVKRIKVVLEGLCDVQAGAGNPYETTLVLRKELETDLGEFFDEGNHAFNFAFIIPSTTPVSQRCIYGRTRYYVKATVEFDGVLSGSVSSPSVAFWVCGNPSPPGELPSTTDLSFQHFSEDLGPVGVGVSSPHLTVAALVNIRLSLLGPVVPVTIVSVNGIITQTFEVSYADGRIARPKPKAHVLTKVDQKASPSLVVPIHNPATCTEEPGQLDEGAIPAQTNPPVPAPSFRPVSKCCTPHPDVPVPDPTPLVHLKAGQEFHHARICRVPTDDHVRPSTLDGSRGTKIRVSHVLSVEVRYKKDGSDEEMVLTMGKPVTITSCCCLVDSLFLPAYSADNATPTITEPIKNHCLCNLTTKSLLDRDGEQLRRAGAIEKPVTERSLGVGREDKSPAWTSGLGEYGSACFVRQDSGFEESGDVLVET